MEYFLGEMVFRESLMSDNVTSAVKLDFWMFRLCYKYAVREL